MDAHTSDTTSGKLEAQVYSEFEHLCNEPATFEQLSLILLPVKYRAFVKKPIFLFKCGEIDFKVSLLFVYNAQCLNSF